MSDASVIPYMQEALYPFKYKDMGDGTFAPQVYNIGSSTQGTGNVANPWYVVDGYTAPVSTTWTSATSSNSTVVFTTSGYDTVIVTLVPNSSHANSAVAFEVYDGVTWLPVKAGNALDYTTTGLTITPVASKNNAYQVPVAGFPQFRVRLINALSAGNLIVTGIVSSAPDTSVVTVGLDPGATNPTTPVYLAPTSYTSNSTIDARQYASVFFTFTSAPSSGYVSVSPDNVNFVQVTAVQNNNTGINTVTNLNAVGIYTIPGHYYVLANFTGGSCFVSGGQ